MQFVFRKKNWTKTFYALFCLHDAYTSIFTYIIHSKIYVLYIIYMQTIRTSVISELGKALYIVYWFTTSLTLHPL